MDVFPLLQYSAYSQHPVKWCINIETEDQYVQLRFISNKHTIAITEHSQTIVDQFYNEDIDRYKHELADIINHVRQQTWKSAYFKARVRQTNFDVSEFHKITYVFLYDLERESQRHGVHVEHEIAVKD